MYKQFQTQLVTGILSCPIIYIPHFDNNLIDDTLTHIMSSADKHSFLPITVDSIGEYDLSKGFVDFKTKQIDKNLTAYSKFTTLLEDIIDKKDFLNRQILLLKNCTEVLKTFDAQIAFQTFASKYEREDYDPLTTIILVSPEPVSSLPQQLEKLVTVIEVETPTTDEILQYIVGLPGVDYSNVRQKKSIDDMVRTLQGLQMYEVKQTLKTVLSLSNGRITPRSITIALEEKKRIVKKSGIIEVIDTDVRFDQVGGLQKLRDDLTVKSAIYSNLGDAEKYNVPIPKGILIIGMPGCGKSMIAKATANMFNVSLLRLDVSRLMGKYVGESEANLRLALATAEAAHPCVLWIDEIEKAFAGGNSKNGDNDMLVMRMMGHFLTWMQERKTPVYIVATANDVMRPEFMRKGRFDEVYYVDFPNEVERAQILDVKIKRYREMRDSIFDFSEIGDCKDVVKDMKGEYGGFSGSEIECVLNMVVEKRFQDYLAQKSAANNQDFVPQTIKIKKDDFKEAIKQIKDSVMANQKSKEKNEKEYLREKTSIERIREMQETYQFVKASK
ncbi:MAG: AAA family ATPase [Bacteroidales bacterium]|nr:AAA family ATPase [Candidatus Liminaster caballi]